MTVFWGLVTTFTDIKPDPTLVSGSVALIGGLAGYFKKENVLGVNNGNG